ncbi:hypothetical protein PVK06_047873 [Gossypium arboreum]|uniref:Uncharacterized protein n=1 Tax=Gossypium arboreum TaxID=29729 RepID=A0ABR0MEX2_GOSAR|nr:hypothetical protein PVK06_047873 [Gossypium arboreum]
MDGRGMSYKHLGCAGVVRLGAMVRRRAGSNQHTGVRQQVGPGRAQDGVEGRYRARGEGLTRAEAGAARGNVRVGCAGCACDGADCLVLLLLGVSGLWYFGASGFKC